MSSGGPAWGEWRRTSGDTDEAAIPRVHIFEGVHRNKQAIVHATLVPVVLMLAHRHPIASAAMQP